MQRKTVLSERLVKSKAALQGMSLVALNKKAGFGMNYIYRLWNKETVTLESINKIANVLNCSVCDLLEEREVEVESQS
jgi:DNA-binding Xre family transcriptional regulator